MYSRLARRAWSLLLLVGLLGMAASLQTSLAYPAPVRTEATPTMTLPASEANPSPSSVASLRTATASPPDPSTLLQTTLANSHTYTLTKANNHQTLSVQTGDTIAVQLQALIDPRMSMVWSLPTADNPQVLSQRNAQRKPDGSSSAVFSVVTPGTASITAVMTCLPHTSAAPCSHVTLPFSVTVSVHAVPVGGYAQACNNYQARVFLSDGTMLCQSQGNAVTYKAPPAVSKVCAGFKARVTVNWVRASGEKFESVRSPGTCGLFKVSGQVSATVLVSPA